MDWKERNEWKIVRKRILKKIQEGDKNGKRGEDKPQAFNFLLH